MFPTDIILLAGIVGFIAALVAGWIVYRRVYAQRLELEHEVRAREPGVDPHRESPRAARRRQPGHERPFGEDVGIP